MKNGVKNKKIRSKKKFVIASLGIVFSLLMSTSCISTPPEVKREVKVPRKVILNTDIGDDIDDAFALALALNSPELEIVGVTVENAVDGREKIALKLLHLAGKDDIPVAKGLAVPGLKGRSVACQVPWAIDYNLTKPCSQNAVDFICSKVKEFPGEITLITYGPLTNLAAAFRKAPEIKTQIKEIVMMGGSLYKGYSIKTEPDVEWNIRCDPEAAKQVFNSRIPITMVGLDVTAHLKLWKADRERIRDAGTPLTKALWELYELWGGEVPTLYDPLAIAVAIDKAFVDRWPIHIEVDKNGYTKAIKGSLPNANVCVYVDKNRFMDFFMERILS
jgi:inosine-uridine nucleoside N-ribohydrolase